MAFVSYRGRPICLKGQNSLPDAQDGFKMNFLTRNLILGVIAALTAGLAGCNSSPNASLTALAVPGPHKRGAAPRVEAAPHVELSAPLDGVEPKFSAIYNEMKDGAHMVPAVKLSQINSAFLRRNVAYATNEAAGSIIVDPNNHYLYYVEGGGRATRYGVGVGREGFVWVGDATIKNKQEWPDWYPPKEMIERRPDLQGKMSKLQSGEGMHGGPGNPLGARAMYLWQGDKDTLFRIHGTNEPWSIGHSESSGCIRMINQDAIDLYSKVQPGARVVVLGSRGAQPVEALSQRPDEKKKKVAAR